MSPCTTLTTGEFSSNTFTYPSLLQKNMMKKAQPDNLFVFSLCIPDASALKWSTPPSLHQKPFDHLTALMSVGSCISLYITLTIQDWKTNPFHHVYSKPLTATGITMWCLQSTVSLEFQQHWYTQHFQGHKATSMMFVTCFSKFDQGHFVSFSIQSSIFVSCILI
jgi:hypothetical protein